MMSWNLLAALIAMGLFSGFAAGLLGIGGGMVLVPFMTMIFAAQHFPKHLIVQMSIATGLATILFTSISSVRAHNRKGAVRWDLVRMFVPGILIGSWIGAWVGKQLNTVAMALLFGIFVAVSATQMLIDRNQASTHPLPGKGALVGVGSGIGFLSGLLGAGGGFVSIPIMTRFSVRIHEAIATSAALGLPVAVAGTLSNIWFGYREPDLPIHSLGFIYLPAVGIVAAMSVLMAPLGVRTAHRLPVQRLRRIFAFVLYALAIYMLWKGITLYRS